MLRGNDSNKISASRSFGKSIRDFSEISKEN
jgi:hypothetical protein